MVEETLNALRSMERQRADPDDDVGLWAVVLVEDNDGEKMRAEPSSS